MSSESLVPLIPNTQENKASEEDVQTLKENKIVISTTKKLLLAVLLVIAYIVWGALISLQPPFYPTEAEKKGATPSQVSFYELQVSFYESHDQ